MPKLARLAHRFCLIRTVSHRYNSHNPYGVMTGFDGGQDQTNYFARPTDHPAIAVVAQYLGGLRCRRDLPPYVVLPAFPGYSQGLRRAGPYGGYLGSAYDPLFSACDPKFSGTRGDGGDFYNADNTPIASQRASSTRVAPANNGKIRPRFSPAIQNSGKNDRQTLFSLMSSATP